MPKKVLIVGSGGREAAFVAQAYRDGCREIFVAPGNGGTSKHATNVPIKADDVEGLLTFAQKEQIDLTIVGPELPLVLGIADRFRSKGLAICGPSAKAAQTEASKIWFKKFLVRHKLPTAAYASYGDAHATGEVLEYIAKRGPSNIVIKADGLMGGKGVILPQNFQEAEVAVRTLTKHPIGRSILVEARLVGFERSAIGIVDGRTVKLFPFTQDYKRVGDGNTGLNTGGMGTHTVKLDPTSEHQMSLLVQRVVEGLNQEGVEYRGFIYLGFMLTKDGPMILECNCRMGDPETQVILPAIDDNWLHLCMLAARGTFDNHLPLAKHREVVCVVLTSGTYPETSSADDPIAGLLEYRERGSGAILHAGTALKSGVYTTNKSGRVLNALGSGKTLYAARENAYSVAREISFPNMHFRSDIGAT